MRPLGSLLLGWIGDRWGTAVALKWSIAFMAIPTVVTGCLPTHKQIGHAATGLLVAMRMLQGMSGTSTSFLGGHTSSHLAKSWFHTAHISTCGSSM
jgi:MFS family permease